MIYVYKSIKKYKVPSTEILLMQIIYWQQVWSLVGLLLLLIGVENYETYTENCKVLTTGYLQ